MTDALPDCAGIDSGPLVIFMPSGRRGRVSAGTTVLDAARKLGADLDSVCGGRGICSKCQIAPSFGKFAKHGITASENALSKWNSVEDRYHRIRGLASGRRLGCQTRILGDIVLDVPLESQLHRQVVRKLPDERPVKMSPAVRLHYVEVAEPDMHESSGDLERLRSALTKQWGIESLRFDLSVLASLQPILRKKDWNATAAIHQRSKDDAPLVIALWPGFRDKPIFGFAVDVGSTTIAAHLCDLASGEVVASSGCMNPQIKFGEDLMSRVSYAMLNDDGAEAMTASVRGAIEELFKEIADSANVSNDAILEAVFVCNPVMHHLLLGIDPTELGQAPFALASADSISASASELELNCLRKSAQVYVLPCIAGHVGADCAAVVLAEGPHRSDDNVLIVDVGTNAEIVFGNKKRTLACSSPTGPAFEGAQISCGQRAAPGAIERVRIDPATKIARFRIIGSELWSDEDGFAEVARQIGITGICGSGIIEAIAEMRLAGILDGSGLIGSPAQVGTEMVVPEGRTHSYLLYGGEAAACRRILVTQGDVRAIQLAKSALYAGARLLLDEFGVDKVDRIVLAGAFGSHISPKHALALGMIPDCRLGCVRSAGNAAGTGARMALCSLAARVEIEGAVRRIEKIETAVEPKFQEHFVNANGLPHAKDPFPELRKVADIPEVAYNLGKSHDGRNGHRRRHRK